MCGRGSFSTPVLCHCTPSTHDATPFPELVLTPYSLFFHRCHVQVLGQRFASIHLRRDDLFRHCVAQSKCEYWPQRQAAECALAKMRAAGLELLFLASDSTNEDLSLFLTMLQEPRDLGPPIRVVRLGRMQGRMWAEAVNRAVAFDDPMVVATVEKVVCAMSMLFMGTHGSTFSQAIADFRMALGTATCEDGDFCSGIGSPEALPL